MLTRLRRWLFKENRQFTHPLTADQLGRFETISGLMWASHRHLFEHERLQKIGWADVWHLDRFQVARKGWPSLVGRLVLMLERWSKYYLYIPYWLHRLGFLDTPEGEIFSLRHHFTPFFWRILRKRYAQFPHRFR